MSKELHTGVVTQVMGPVIDVRFPQGHLPELLHAVLIRHGEKTLTAEVAQHIGDGVVRCIAMSSTDGLVRGAGACADGGSGAGMPDGKGRRGNGLCGLDGRCSSEPQNCGGKVCHRTGSCGHGSGGVAGVYC